MTTPDWSNSDSWDEFEWEEALKHRDDLAAHYFRMLERFGDLPDADQIITAKLGHQSLLDFEQELFGTEDLWQDDDEFDDDDELEEDGMAADQEGLPLPPGDSLYYETMPVYRKVEKITRGWCNIQATVLRGDSRMWGLQVMFRLSRIMSYLAISIGDGTCAQQPASITLAKRAAYESNLILGELQRKSAESDKYKRMLLPIIDLLMEAHEMMVDYLMGLRKPAAR
jgi:hypothetical protein